MEGSSRGLSEGMVREKARCNTVTVCRQTAADEVAQIFLCLYFINSYNGPVVCLVGQPGGRRDPC